MNKVAVTINDLLDLTLREVLENYVLLHNLECDYFYGLAKTKDVERLFKNYNINDDYPEAFSVCTIIQDDVVVDYDDEIITYEKMTKIMDNLGITKKE